MTDTKPMPNTELHNRLSLDCSLAFFDAIDQRILQPAIEAELPEAEIMAIVESCILAAVTIFATRGADKIVLDHLVDGIKKRRAEQRLGGTPVGSLTKRLSGQG